jgi:energy-coupling factor transport system substrate-specific component
MTATPSRQVISGLVGAALYILLSWITNLYPLPAVGGVIFRPAVAIIIFFGIAYGPWAGLLAGLVGSVVSDYLTSLDFYWNWSLGNALIGQVAGFLKIPFKDFGTGRGLLRANVGGTLGIAVGTMFAAVGESIRSGIDLGTALVEYFPLAFLGYFAGAIVLLPIIMMACAAVILRRAR